MWHADSETVIFITSDIRFIIPEMVMTSFLVGNKTLLTRERYEIDEKLYYKMLI